ncbi:MAG: NUDIX domain-containing protein [Myxococcota bacterium]
MRAPRFCVQCAGPLVEKEAEGRTRLVCSAEGCGFIHYGNPTPVVAAIVEHQGNVILVRNKGWPEKWFGLVTGFLEAGETPEDGILRELREELGLTGKVQGLVGVYGFVERNELIVAYHVVADGEIVLGDELEAFKPVPPEKLKPWPFGTGQAVREWLERRGLSP